LEGRSVRFEFLNQDSREYYAPRTVYRSEKIDDFDEDDDDTVVSPYNTTFTAPEFGEYYVSIDMFPRNLEIILRFRVL